MAEASEVTKANKAEWNSLGQVCAVLGSQWGDEGKGKLVDILAQVGGLNRIQTRIKPDPTHRKPKRVEGGAPIVPQFRQE